MRHQQTRYARRNGEAWAPADERLLLELLASGQSHRSIAVRLGRTTLAVTRRVEIIRGGRPVGGRR